MLVSPQLIGAFWGTTWQCSFICAIQLRQGFDCTKEPVLHDITLVLGFMQSLKLLLRIRQRGLSWVALPCGSFSFMSSSGHRRSWWNPYGNLQWQFVQLGNTICSRTCLLLTVAICRSVVFFVENPGQSALNYWPFINFLMAMPWLNSQRTSWFPSCQCFLFVIY